MAGRKTDRGYLIEGKVIPKANAPFKLKAGEKFGMDIVVNDALENSNKITRKTQMTLHGTAANCNNTSKFGRYKLNAKGPQKTKKPDPKPDF